MPYNSAPISPQQEMTGSSVLPMARVKKIIAMDEDIVQCSSGAAFVISVATEMFIRQLTEHAHNVVKSERKPRRNLQYKDFATAVARIDNLEFLSDVIPKTTTFKQFKEKKAREAANGIEAGQTTLDGHQSAKIDDEADEDQPTNGVNGDSKPHDDRSPISPAAQSLPVNGSPMVDRTIQGGHGHTSNEDVAMTG